MRRSGRARRLSLVLGGLVLVASPIAGCQNSGSEAGSGLEKDTITVAALPVVDAAPLHIAQKQKLFEAEGLKVQIKPVAQSLQALPALTKGDLDLVGANYVSFLQAHDKGTIKLSIVAEGATLSSNLTNVLVTPDSPIKTPKDLEGKRVAVNLLNNIQSLTLNAILSVNNVDASKVRYVAVPFPQMGAALEKEQIDAVHINEPFLSDVQQKLGARVVVNGGAQPVTGTPLSGYVGTQDFIKRYPKAAAASKAAQTASSDRKRVEEVLPTYARIGPEVASRIKLPGYPTSLSIARFERVTDLMMREGLLKQKPDARTVLFQPKA
jgi:NitT/TauT family transport system substrate-binding protein